MRRILLRIGRSRVAAEGGDVDAFLDAEKLSSELILSVYEIEAPEGSALHGRVVQARAEHQASAGARPPPAGYDLDISCGELPTPTPSPGTSRFRFTREAHRDVAFVDPAQRRRVFERVLAEADHRIFKVTREQMAAYVAQRVAESDPEWLALLADGAVSKPWLKLLRKHQDH